MNSVRAYNMNLNQLIKTDHNANHNNVRDHGFISGEQKPLLKADNDITPASATNVGGGVYVEISSIWQEVASEINLKNASSNEVADLSSSLFNAGAITFEDHINLSFQDSPDADEKTDIIARWQERQEDAIHQGAVHEELNDIVRIQSILGYVNSLKS